MSRRMDHARVNMQKRISKESVIPVPKVQPTFPENDWLKLWFGKHQGTTLPELLLSDPMYVIEFLLGKWIKGIFKRKPGAAELRLAHQLEVLRTRAQNIRIPLRKRDTHRFAVWQCHEGALGGITLVPRGKKPKAHERWLRLHSRGSKCSFFLPLAFRYYGLGLNRMADTLGNIIAAERDKRPYANKVIDFFSNSENFDLAGLKKFTSLEMTSRDVLLLKRLHDHRH